ncbi:MAG: hypothetical protein LBC30_04055 [Puniceicoccales bacterium]|jgi:hypothetical protein|nr:hypothetical protein [Puniceicoccales bacterium]
MCFGFASDYEKTILWLALSVFTATVSYFIHRTVAKIRKTKAQRNFSNPHYVIGSAVVNMERAITYEDDANFRFFARYAIRTCLGMGKAYPPNEPSAMDIRERLLKMHLEESFIEKVLQIYSLESLSEDPQEWKNILTDTHKIVQALLKQSV